MARLGMSRNLDLISEDKLLRNLHLAFRTALTDLFLSTWYFDHAVILSTGAYFQNQQPESGLFSRGAYFYGVVINACNFLVGCSCVGTN